MCRPSDFPPYIDMLDVVDPKQAPSWDSTPYAGNAMTEPTTEAGRRLVRFAENMTEPEVRAEVATIEAEAVNAALDKVAAEVRDANSPGLPDIDLDLVWDAIEAARPKPDARPVLPQPDIDLMENSDGHGNRWPLSDKDRAEAARPKP